MSERPGSLRSVASGVGVTALVALGCAGPSGSSTGTAAAAAPAIDAGADVVAAHYRIVRAPETAQVPGAISYTVDLEIAGRGGLRSSVRIPVLLDGPASAETPWLARGARPTDRAFLTVRAAAPPEPDLEGGDGPILWRSPAPVPLGAIDPRAFLGQRAPRPLTDDEASAAAFVRFCEDLTLLRDPMNGAHAPGELARAWFGGALAAPTDEPHAAVLTLAEAVVALFGRERSSAADDLESGGWHAPSGDVDWAVPRWLLLHDEVGAVAFREAVRRLFDEHAYGAPVPREAVAAAFQREDVTEFLGTWIAGPGRPMVATSWRSDAERSRVLVRVDQRHPIEDGGVPAYTFDLPLALVMEDGRTFRREVRVARRRELFELPSDEVPAEVRFDPDGELSVLVEFVEDDVEE
ncbi:MAG: hypothetical protein AAGB93_05635 [Planctomycetota bacterium]